MGKIYQVGDDRQPGRLRRGCREGTSCSGGGTEQASLQILGSRSSSGAVEWTGSWDLSDMELRGCVVVSGVSQSEGARMANKLISKAELGFLVNVIILEVVESGKSNTCVGWEVEESSVVDRGS